MAIEAWPINNPFPSLLPYSNSKEMLNFDSNLHMVGGTAGAFLPVTDESMFLAKMMNNRIVNPPLKDDSGLTFNINNNAVDLPLPRKRPREPCGNSTASLSFLGEDLSLQMIQQQLEIDRLIFLHTENFRIEIEEQMRNQSRILLIPIEQKIAKMLIDKEEQIQKMGKLNATLQDRVKSLYLENQLWRDLAQSNEATANVLRSNLEHLLVQINTKADEEVASDAESCCGSSDHVAVDDATEVDREEILRWRKVARTRGGEGGKRLCRRCGDTESSVLVLPCRHLCLCAACGPAVNACPICNTIKNATVHVNFA